MRMPSICPHMPWNFAFFASETALTLSAYGAYYRFDLLFSRFFIHAIIRCIFVLVYITCIIRIIDKKQTKAFLQAVSKEGFERDLHDCRLIDSA